MNLPIKLKFIIMKKFIYLNIVLATLLLSSFRSQDQIGLKSSNDSKKVTTENYNSKNYATFDSSAAREIESAKPPRD